MVFPDTTTPSNDDFKPSSDEDNQFSNITISDDECVGANCTTTARIQDHKAFIPGLLGDEQIEYIETDMGNPTIGLVYYTATLHYNCSFESSLPYIATLL